MKMFLRGFTTNHAQLDREDSDPLLRPLVLAASVTDVADRFAYAIQQQAGWKIESREQVDETIRIHLTRRTRVFRFVDDIHVRVEPAATAQHSATAQGSATAQRSATAEHHDSDATIVYAESRSRIGKGDLGQNRRNLRQLHQVLADLNR